MKRVLLALALSLVSFVASAEIASISAGGQIFGIADGVYRGRGVLLSQSSYVPDLNFDSTRQLEHGVITAHTVAKKLGIQLAEAQARLKIVATSVNNFDLLDLDGDSQKVGEGSCDATSCTFEVTVMNGKLKLNETWVPDQSGFSLKNSSQVFNGLPAKYEGQFLRQE